MASACFTRTLRERSIIRQIAWGTARGSAFVETDRNGALHWASTCATPGGGGRRRPGRPPHKAPDEVAAPAAEKASRSSRASRRRGPVASNAYSNDAHERHDLERGAPLRVRLPSAERFHEQDSFVVALAYDRAGSLPDPCCVEFDSATHPHCRSSPWLRRGRGGGLGLLRHRVARDLPPGLAQKVRVWGLHAVTGAAAGPLKLKLLSNAYTVGAAAAARVRRRGLLSPFNFAAFYLPHVLEAKRILYLDTDVLVQRDVVRALEHYELGGKAVAAVEDCSQKFEKYVNFQLLNRLLKRKAMGGLSRHYDFNASTCVLTEAWYSHRCGRWRALGLTLAIESLVEAYVKCGARLWRGGVSQPPFLLALGGRYAKLDPEV